MRLRKSLFASLAMMALAVPVTGGAIVTLSANPVLAKGGNGKGGSARGERGRSDRGISDRGKPDRGKPDRGRPDRGKGGTARSGQGGSGKSSSGKPAKPAARSAPDSTASEDMAMHPSELGSMNGAMNANINAVLAHIRNGNTNGPVGALAGLAVADHNAAAGQEVIDTAAGFDALETALEDANYESLEEYRAAVKTGEIDPIAAVEEASEVLGDAAGDEAPTEEEIAEAEATVEALSDAEAGIIDAWNKSDAATDEEKAALLAALRDRLSGESETIAEAIDAADTSEESNEDEGAEGGSETLDPVTQAMIDDLKF